MSGNAGICNKRFCPINTQPSGVITPTPPAKTDIGVAVANKRPNNVPSVDPNQVDRNRQLRYIMEENEARRYRQEAMARKQQIEAEDRRLMQERSFTMDRSYMAKGNQEASKLRLLITLQKLQAMSVTYTYVSDYFTNCLKGMSQTGDIAIISSILIFDKYDLVNSDTCYTTAITAIGKTTTTNFGVIYDAIESLSLIVKDFKV